jgi:feruloyl-CoA synthase
LVVRFATSDVIHEARAGGVQLFRSAQPLRPYDRAVGVWLTGWAERAPSRPFLAERRNGLWKTISYRQTLDAARRIGESLLTKGLSAATPVLILSENSINHALVTLGAMQAGVPVAPISPAYSLVSSDFAKLTSIVALLEPRLTVAEDPARFTAALAAARLTITSVETLLDIAPTVRIDEAFATVTPDTIAKILFTSGSTDVPKGVINTHRMLCSSQQSWAQLWPFLDSSPPIVCDWLPWHHTVGGNAIFNLVLRNGGTLYIDAGRPIADRFATTLRNLRDVSPTLYFNVPRGFDLLAEHLEQDEAFCARFFARLELMYSTGAALSRSTWDRLRSLSRRYSNGRVLILAGWGSTEMTLATRGHALTDHPANVGTPGPGVEIALIPRDDRLEARVRGPQVTPGYYRRPDLTRDAYDNHGFYRSGDALRLAAPDDPSEGFVFDGRVTEDFKLASGTWVNAGIVRLQLIAACAPLVQDAVITGHDRHAIGALVFLNQAAVARDGLDGGAVRARLGDALRSLRADRQASSMAPSRLLILDEPPSLDADEITDKGYLNQRAILTRRAAAVEQLYAGHPDAIVI